MREDVRDNDGIWDAVVIGAGPAGSVSAALLAGRGWRVLLVEKKVWPREKACGGCVNAAGLRMLREAGLDAVLQDAVELRQMTIHLGGRALKLQMPAGRAVERRVFDDRLVREAVGRGCVFLAETSAKVVERGEAGETFREVALQGGGREAKRVRARVVLACDGMGGEALKEHAWARYATQQPARLGFATTVGADYPVGAIGMCVSDGEYVGLVRLPDGRVHVGASLTAARCREEGGPGAVVKGVLARCGFGAMRMGEAAHWTGTSPLSGVRAGVAGLRVLVVGDSCGYVEPFTGEGIAWAVRGAILAVGLLPGDLRVWPAKLEARWAAVHRREIVGRQAWCKGFRFLLQRPGLAAVCMRAAQRMRWLPEMVARRVGV